MNFGFSYVGAILLIMLFTPNIIWAKHKPKDYDKYADSENKLLLALERTGEATVSATVLIFSDFNVQRADLWLAWLVCAFAAMCLYEVFWIRYFRSEKTMKDFYRDLLGIPVAGATLPVAAVLLLAVYGKNPILFISGVVLGVGHIGIHLEHKRQISKT